MADGVIGGAIHPRVWAHVAGAGEGERPSWQLGHERLVRVGKARARLDAEEAVWLVVCEALRAHRELGFATFVEYVSAVVGWDAHSAMERIRVARTLVKLPAVFGALADAELCWSSARELTRVATPETEAAWVGAARELRAEDVQRLVSGRRPGDLPESPADESARRHAVRFEIEGSTLAVLRQAQDEHRRRTGASLDDDAFIGEVMRVYLSGAGDAEPASTGAAAQVMVTLCPSCRAGSADAGGRPVTLAPAELETLCCDARVIPAAQTEPVLAGDPVTSQQGPEPATSQRGREPRKSERGRAPRKSEQGQLAAESQPGPEPRESQRGRQRAGVERRTSQRGLHERVPSPAVMAEIDRRAGLRVATEIPKTVRNALLRRHHGGCALPGCHNTACLHIHHLDPRSEGGVHDPERMAPLCDVHHRAVHDGRVVVGGAWSAGFVFAHADGTPYGTRALPDPAKSRAAKVAYGSLVELGFKQTEARAATDAIVGQITAEMPLEEAVRLALAAASRLPSQRHVSRVREALAEYAPSWAVA